MTVGLVGSGPARSAIRAALEDVSVQTTDIDPAECGDMAVTVVVDEVGGDDLSATNHVARKEGATWLGVEIGGVGGRKIPSVDAAVAGFGPAAGCYECLRARVEANDPSTQTAPDSDPTVERFAGAIAGRALARLTNAEDRTPLGRVIEVPYARRRYLPVPGCACGADRDWDVHLTTTSVDRTTAADRMEGALDSRVGLVSEVGEAESFPAPYYLASVCNTEGFSDATAAGQAAGVAVDWDVAFLKAMGEALERYSAGVYRTETLLSRPPDGRTIPPEAFVGATAAATNGSHRWVPGLDIHGRTTVTLPASVVFFPPPGRAVRTPTTTGLALERSSIRAVLGGLYETIERDAAMLAWYSSYEPLGLAVADEEYETLVRRARSEDLTTTALLLTQDVDVPVVGVAVHRSDGDWPRFAAGMSAALDPSRAARSALTEALQNWMELRGMGPADAADVSGAVGEYASFPETARRFVDVETTVPAASVGPSTIPSGREELDELLDRLAEAGLSAYAVRITPPDVAELGFEAVRCLIPAAQPLVSGDPTFGDRAGTIPPSLGFEARLDRDHHPFP